MAIKIKSIRALRDHVIVTDMNFKERLTNSGLIIPSDDMKSAGVRPRWGQVYVVGPDQTAILPGQWVCVMHGRWTRGVKVEADGKEFTVRRIDNNDILLVSDEQPNDETLGL